MSMPSSESTDVNGWSDPADPQIADPGDAPPAAEPPATEAGRRPTSLVARVRRVAAVVAAVALCAVLVGWWATGGKWLIVRTPSMGTYAPVGTLLWVRPASIGDLHVGDVITYHSPAVAVRGDPGLRTVSQTFTHRVVARDPDGTVQTKGDLNAVRDPWRIDQRHLVGRVEARWWGMGWLVRALPLLLPAGIALWVLTRLFLSKRSRLPLRVLGLAGIVAIATVVYNPLFGAQRISMLALNHPARAKATYIGTGMLPVKLQADRVPSVRIRAGEIRSIVARHPAPDGQFHVKVSPEVPWVTWVVVVGVCLAPAIWSVVVGVEPPPPPGKRRRKTRPWRRGGGDADAGPVTPANPPEQRSEPAEEEQGLGAFFPPLQ